MKSTNVSELEAALRELGTSAAVTSQQTALGATEEDPVRRAIVWLHRKLCPRSKQIVAVLRSDEATTVGVVIDAIISAATDKPMVAATVSRTIAAYGLDRFCAEPLGIIDPGEEP